MSDTMTVDKIHDMVAKVLRTDDIGLLRSLADTISFHYAVNVTTGQLEEYVRKGSESQLQPLLSFIIAACDAEPDKTRPPATTPAGSPERLAWVVERLGLSDVLDDLRTKVRPPQRTLVLQQNFTDWYTPEREHQTTHYWDDYVTMLTRKGWSAESIQTVESQAREVIRRIEDPHIEHTETTGLSARGLVVGYVQSGKTANFTAVAAKAIDAGYRFVVILAGTLENLRQQTQRRLDKELFGRESILDGRDESELSPAQRKEETYFGDDEEWEEDEAFISHGLLYSKPGFPRIKRVTTTNCDYRGVGSSNTEITFPRGDETKPVHDQYNLDRLPCIVAVVKKNSRVLAKLNADIVRASKRDGVLPDLPTLIIDDESDQASVNTKKQTDATSEKERTAVNQQIVNLLQNCPRAQYVGYTATPFANVFIDPNDPADLYPRDFVLMLGEPPQYRGAKWYHDRDELDDHLGRATIQNSRSKAFIRILEEDDDWDETTDNEVRVRELQKALDMFVLTGAIKKYREDNVPGLKFRHHTMLVHEGVSTVKHADAKAVLDKLWNERAYNLGMPNDDMRRLFEKDLLPVMQVPLYSDGYPVPESYEELIPYISAAYKAMMTNTAGQSTPILQVDNEGNQSPNFEMGSVWKVLVGGAKLSRGYTLEGLTISYFRRKTGAADTLMQTGRWFGFRRGYQDLVRIYAPESLIEMFESAMQDEEAFRDRLKAYSKLTDDNTPAITPAQLPPLVQQSCPDLLPTSPSKMFNARIDMSACAPDPVSFDKIPTRLQTDRKIHNFSRVVMPLLECLSGKLTPFGYALRQAARGYDNDMTASQVQGYAGFIPAERFIELVDALEWSGDYKQRVINAHLAYLKSISVKGKHSNEPTDCEEIMVVLPRLARALRSSTAAKSVIKVDGIGFDVPLVRRGRRLNDPNASLNGTPGYFAYIAANIAAGRDPSTIREEDARLVGDTRTFEPSTIDWDTKNRTRRGAIVMSLFDDRDPRNKKDMYDADGHYIPADPMKGEIGFSPLIASPLAAIHGAADVVRFSVRRASADGSSPVVVDSGATD